MMKFLKKRWYLILIFLFIAGFIFYRAKTSSEAATGKSSLTLKRQNLRETLTLSGEIDAEEKAALKFQASGRLAWVGVREGDAVRKYQVIATLDQRDLRNRLTKYLNTYAIQRNTFEQTKDDNWNDQYDFSQNIRDDAKRILENNQFSLNNAVLDVEYQNLSVEYGSLTTPIDGVITHIDTPYAGVNITPAGAEFDVVNPDTIFFSATADQTDVVNIAYGNTGSLVFDAFPEKTYQGSVYFVSFTPDTNETGTVYQIKLKLDDAATTLPLKLGMTGDADFLIKERKNVLSVQQAYLKSDKKGSYVNLKENNKTVRRYVETGEDIDGKVIILKGLKEGDVVYD